MARRHPKLIWLKGAHLGYATPDYTEAELFAIEKTKGIKDRNFFLGLCAGMSYPSDYKPKPNQDDTTGRI